MFGGQYITSELGKPFWRGPGWKISNEGACEYDSFHYLSIITDLLPGGIQAGLPLPKSLFPALTTNFKASALVHHGPPWARIS